MAKKKKDNKAKQIKAKKTEAQKKVAKSLKRPARAPKTSATGEVRLTGKEQSTPTGTFKPIPDVPPQIREAYKTRFEESQLAEIGKEESIEKQRERFEGLPTPIDPEKVKEVRGDTAIPEAERPLTPKPTPLSEPTPGQQARKQKGRLPRGVGGTRIFTFQESRSEESPFTIKNVRDVARQQQKGRSISTLPPHVQATALALAHRDHALAKSTGKTVNNIEPDSKTPDIVSIHGDHHARLAEAIHAYGAKEEDFAKLPVKGSFVDKVHVAWNILKEHERSKSKIPLWPEHEGATHWQDPRTKRVSPLSAGAHPEFYKHGGETESLVRAPGEAAWKALKPKTEGWEVLDLRGQKTWVFREHPAAPFSGSHQVRSLFQHIQNTLKGDFPEAPIVTGTESADSRRATAQRVREKLVDPYSVVDKHGVMAGYRRRRGRAERTFVAAPSVEGKPDNVTVKETPQTEFVATTPGTPEKRRPKAPKRYLLQQMGVAKKVQAPEVGQQLAKMLPPDSTKIGPSGEILRSKPTITRGAKVEATKSLKNKTKIKITPTYKVTPGPVDQPLPGMEGYGLEQPEKPGEKASRYWKGTLGTGAPESRWKGKWVETPATPSTPAIPGSARPTPQPEFAGETGMEQLSFYKEKHGGVIPSQSREVAVRGTTGKRSQRRAEGRKPRVSPTQLRPNIQESPQPMLPFKGDMGQQWLKITNPVTKELQEKAQQGAVPGVAADMPRGVAKKRSTRSFKGRR